jgi:hypothetical protein
MESKLDYHLRIGRKLFSIISSKLNTISDEHIRTELEYYRRQEDFYEMCLALSLLVQHLGLDPDSIPSKGDQK